MNDLDLIGPFQSARSILVNGEGFDAVLDKVDRRLGRYTRPLPLLPLPDRKPIPRYVARTQHGVAVIIISHNYGRFLTHAIESVLGQSLRAAEIVVIDDDSTDDTRIVAAKYADQGVRYEHVAFHSVTKNRKYGMELTSAPVLLFLDADDAISPEYLERGLKLFDDPAVGIVHSDVQRFGDYEEYVRFPEQGNIHHHNFMHSASLIRRTAIQCSEAFSRPAEVTRLNQDDMYLWKRIVTAGWKVAKSSGVHIYRRHGGSHCAQLLRDKISYYHLASLEHETVTLFVPLSGRLFSWPKLRRFLAQQTWPRRLTRLVLCDTSNSRRFGKLIRRWALSCDYKDVRYYTQKVGRAGVADRNRHTREVYQAVQNAMPLIYNRAIREATTEHIVIVEDDVVPPMNAVKKLLMQMDADVATVSAAYPSRFDGQLVAWDRHGKYFEATDTGVRDVAGNGFGCVVIRKSIACETVFHNGGATANYDQEFYRWLNRTPWRAVLNCDVVCAHLDKRGA